MLNSGALIKGPHSEKADRPLIKRHSAERWVTQGVSACVGDVCVRVCAGPQVSAEVQGNKPLGQNIWERADEPLLSPRKDKCGKQ